MLCRKCEKEIPEDAIFCCYCGVRQQKKPIIARKRANGTGCVKHLSGRRRKPWTILITKNKKQIYMGFYEKKTDAEETLNKISPASVSDRYNDTFEDIYNAWKEIHFRNLTDHGEQGYKLAWNHFQLIKNIKMREIKADVLQKCVDAKTEDKPLSRSVCEKMKQLSSQLCKYAMQQDIINKNYAQFIVLPKLDKKEKETFTDDEISILFDHDSDERVKIILTLIYTGFRIDELFGLLTDNVHLNDGYVIGGEKTEAGKDRIVPINDLILPYIKEWYNKAVQGDFDYLITNGSGKKKDVKNFRSREFYPALEELKIQGHVDKNHSPRLTPHSTRHTFASLAARSGVAPEVLQKLIGHADYSTTADIYIHESLEDLKSGMSKITRK